MLATILPRCKTNPNSLTISRLKGILTQNTVYHDKNEIHNRVRFKRFSPKRIKINILSRFPGFPKCHRQNILNESIFAPPYFQHGRPTTMFRASASNHRQHKHLFCRPCYRHALYQYAFALKSSEFRTKNVLEYLETRPNTSSKVTN